MAKTYSDKLKSPKWQKKRLEILSRDNWKCRYCDNEEKQLQVHHLKYTERLPHNEPSINLITVCEDCHKVVEFLKHKMYSELGVLHCINERENHFMCYFPHHVVFVHKMPILHAICIHDQTFHIVSDLYKKHYGEAVL